MNEQDREKNNQTLYQQTFDEIHASKELLGKVNDMKNEKIMKRATKIGYAIAAAIAVCLISSNVVTYAATGSSWVEKIIVYINGEARDVDMTYKTDSDGNGYYEGVIEDDSSTAYIAIEDDENGNLPGDVSIDIIDLNNGYLVTENGSVYLVAANQKIDITEDIQDGVCDGTFSVNGIDYNYHITGTAEEYNIEIFVE